MNTEIRSREDIKNFILQLEKDFPVNDWKVNGIHYWPVYRTRLYMHLVHETENPKDKKPSANIKKTAKSPSLKQRLLRKASKLKKKAEFFIWLRKLPKADVIFCGSHAHRADFNGISYNKFYDQLIREKGLQNYCFLEYGNILENATYTSENLIDFNKGLNLFRHVYEYPDLQMDLPHYDRLLKFLAESGGAAQSFALKHHPEFLHQAISQFIMTYELCRTILMKVKPTELYMLFYYGNPGFALMAAANQAHIKTIEMQHGPQPSTHLGYNNWSKLPEEGYDVLPRNFFSWDKDTADILSETFKNNTKYSVTVTGNPWLRFQFGDFDLDPQFILYTLQPSPVLITQLLSSNIIELIRNSPQKWYLRFHPRQSNTEITEIKKLIEEENLIEHVEFEKAQNAPLPVLLKNCRLHVTHFSGSMIEAETFGKHTVLLSKLGAETFRNKIENGSATYLNYENANFTDEFFKINDNVEKN